MSLSEYKQDRSPSKSKRLNRKSKLQFPHVIIILLIMMFLATIASWVIPSGEYQREEGPDGNEVVVPDSFSFTDNHPVNIFEMFKAIPEGMEDAGMIVFTVLIMGGAWKVINATGAISIAINKITKKLHGKELLAIPVLMILFSSIASIIGGLELAIVYLPVIMPLVIALGFDILSATAITLVGTIGAFSASLTNPFTVGLGQKIAGLPLYSGIGFRIIVLISFVTVGILYVARYSNKIRKTPEKSLVYKENSNFLKNNNHVQTVDELPRHKIITLVLIVGLGILIFGILKFGWYMYELGAMFFILALVIGMIGRLSLNTIADKFIEGTKDVILAAIVVGIARSVLVIIENGQIIDTFIMYLVKFLDILPGAMTAVGILIIQSVFNLFVNSGSGQTLITMPILAPLADLVGITKQTTVLGTQLGDGITNIIFPVSGVLMACLAYTKISYVKWLKFIYPLVLIWTGMGALFLVIAQFIKWGPF